MRFLIPVFLLFSSFDRPISTSDIEEFIISNLINLEFECKIPQDYFYYLLGQEYAYQTILDFIHPPND